MKLKPAQAAAGGAIALASIFGIGALTAASASDDDGTTPAVEEEPGEQQESRDEGRNHGDCDKQHRGNESDSDTGGRHGPGSPGGERPEPPSDSDSSEDSDTSEDADS